jgi:AraC family transcriptional regulator of arabinose operon
MRADVVSFRVSLRSGITVIVPPQAYGSIYREHGMDGWILNATSAGVGRINSGAGRFHVHPGELLLFKPLARHDYGAEERLGRWTHLWVYFFPRPDWFELLTWPEAAPGILRLDLRGSEHRARIFALFEELIAWSRSPLARRDQLAMSALEQLLLWCDAANPLAGHNRLDPRLQRVLDHLGRHAGDPVRIAELARIAGLSPSRLSHLFRGQVGTTPMQWLESHRIERARELLLMSGRPIAEVGAEAGMPNPVWFSRLFRRHAGMTPSAFRRRGVPRPSPRRPGPAHGDGDPARR